jgi:hypothetical protein
MQAATVAGATTFTSGPVTFSCSNLRINEWKSHIKGYMINDSAKEQIRQSIAELGGLVFPSQECQYIQFNNAPTANGLRIQVNTALFNTSSLLVGFPNTANEITCLQNPSMIGMQMKLDGTFIPNEGFDTHSVEHLHDQVAIANLDGPLNCSLDYENSIVLEHNQPNGTRWSNALTDDTSYLCQFQTERSDAAFVVDGINTGGQNKPIELNATPKWKGDMDTYYIPITPPSGSAPVVNTNKPFLLECRDTMLILTLDGLRYFNDRTPNGSQTDPRMYFNPE